jgi:hypothetical protein
MVAVSVSFISADKVKQGAKISMGTDEQSMFDIISEKAMPILIVVDRSEYFKRQREQ